MLDPTRDNGTGTAGLLRPLDYVPAAISLTPRGDVAVALNRLRRQLGPLDAPDHAWAVAALRQLLEEVCCG